MRQQSFNRNFSLIFILNLVFLSGNYLLGDIFPLHLKSLGAAGRLIGLNTAMFTLGAILTRPLVGDFLDRRGRRPVLTYSLLAMAILYGLYTVTFVPQFIIAIRLLQGVIWGFLSTAIQTVASDNIPAARFGEGYSIFMLSSSVAGILSPLITFPWYRQAGIRPIVLAAAICALIAVGLAARIQFKAIKALETDRQPADLRSRLRQLVEPHALLPAAVTLLICLALGGYFSFSSLLLIERGISNVGPFLMVFPLASLLVRPFSGRLSDRLGSKLTLYPGIIMFAFGLFLIGRVESSAGFIIGSILFSSGFCASTTALLSVAVLNSPVERLGAVNATVYNGMDGGMFLGAILGGLLADAVGYSRLCMILSVTPLIGLLLSVMADRGILTLQRKRIAETNPSEQ